jgi:hypothetical protein
MREDCLPESTRGVRTRITLRGLALLREESQRVDIRLPRSCPGCVQSALSEYGSEQEHAGASDDATSGQAPHETMDMAYLRTWYWMFWQLWGMEALGTVPHSLRVVRATGVSTA